jgi:hypothetical protein
MAAPTDLTWQQLNDVFGYPIVAQIPAGESTTNLMLNLTILSPEFLTTDQGGVVKALMKLLELARKAQEKLNEGKPSGEKLAAFPAPTIGNQASGQVPIERRIASRIELSSATSIVGVTA